MNIRMGHSANGASFYLLLSDASSWDRKKIKRLERALVSSICIYFFAQWPINWLKKELSDSIDWRLLSCAWVKFIFRKIQFQLNISNRPTAQIDNKRVSKHFLNNWKGFENRFNFRSAFDSTDTEASSGTKWKPLQKLHVRSFCVFCWKFGTRCHLGATWEEKLI